MNKNEKVKKARELFIKKKINESKNTAKTIKELENRLFLSEKTILRDFKK